MTEVLSPSPEAAAALDTKVVLIACPVTYDLVPTGVHVADLAELNGQNLLAACVSCGGEHRWRPLEAVLAP
jgi:hypothetical protein